MHKKIMLTILLVIFELISLGLVCPYLVSEDSNDAVVVGGILAIASLYLGVYIIIRLWKNK